MLENPNPEVIISGDIIRLEQAMINLLANPIEYPPGADAFSICVEKINSSIKTSITGVDTGISKANYEKFLSIFPGQRAITRAVGFGDVSFCISRNN